MYRSSEMHFSSNHFTLSLALKIHTLLRNYPTAPPQPAKLSSEKANYFWNVSAVHFSQSMTENLLAGTVENTEVQNSASCPLGFDSLEGWGNTHTTQGWRKRRHHTDFEEKKRQVLVSEPTT